MAAYNQVNNKVLIRSPNRPVVCQSTGVQYRPVSVAGSITDGRVVPAVENSSRRRLINDQVDRSPRSMVSPRIPADLDPNCVQLLEMRARSAHAYRGPSRNATPAIVEVIEQVAVSTVKPPRSTPEHSNLHGVSSRGAWEGRLRPRHRRDPSQSNRGCRRPRSSSSSSSVRCSDRRSPLATPLHVIAEVIVEVVT